MLRFRQHISLYFMFIPVAVYFLVFLYFPLLRGFTISLQEFRMIGERPFVGLEQYRAVLTDPFFWQALRNTLLIGAGQLAFGFAASLAAALSLGEVLNPFFKKFSQMVLYIPHLFSWVIVGGIWIFLLSPDAGMINELLKLLGAERPVHFLADERYARWVMIGTSVWKEMGYTCIIYLAAMTLINPSLYEAARIDGAGRLKQLLHITLPQLVPAMKTVFLLQLLAVLRMFDQLIVMRNPAIYREVDVLMTYVYEKGIQQFHMDVASAASFLVIAATLLLTLIFTRVTRYGH
ncbi:ABC transporter permease subunit [Paenibacillus sp. S150]|uniref:ABC transporter permease subunit n=1 Tax=Paenibacillus sp. S150 TaxID=2749826 RepID=UPI001C59F7DD|nr:ABC transporter permease subunit [Paenibacillus sp. S150]MBW4082493.1 sugar ABC transporter permease [Paenibacillus sp. S150]